MTFQTYSNTKIETEAMKTGKFDSAPKYPKWDMDEMDISQSSALKARTWAVAFWGSAKA